MVLNYKNNLIKVKKSKHLEFWFELYINMKPHGDYRSIDEAIAVAKEIIDNAIDHLKTIDNDTVIDHNWEEYLVDDLTALNSLLILTPYDKYKEFVCMFEGVYVIDFLEKYS